MHGLILAKQNISTSIQWYNGTNTTTGATSNIVGSGNSNTNTIVSNQGTGNYAAKICSDLVLNGYSDWYLPSKDELNKLYLNRVAIGGFTTTAGFSNYWSSTQFDFNYPAYQQAFESGTQNGSEKNAYHRVRAVRSF